jgi:hypothetical protein
MYNMCVQAGSVIYSNIYRKGILFHVQTKTDANPAQMTLQGTIVATKLSLESRLEMFSSIWLYTSTTNG